MSDKSDNRLSMFGRDEEFAKLLNTAGLAAELSETELERITANLDQPRVDVRRIDILEHYYQAFGDQDTSARRRQQDRFFAHHETDNVTAHELVAMLSELTPEIAPVSLQRIGAKDGPLVLRSGEHFSAISDEDDEYEPEDTVAVRAMVRSLNALLARASIKERLVPLVPDEQREIYLGVTEEGGMMLLQGGCIELLAVAALRDFAGW